MVSPQLLSLLLLLLAWSELPVDQPGQRRRDPVGQLLSPPWRSSMLEPRTLEPSRRLRWVHYVYVNGGDMGRGCMSVAASGHALQVAVVDTVVRPERLTRSFVP
jgi:hypothetical protein